MCSPTVSSCMYSSWTADEERFQVTAPEDDKRTKDEDSAKLDEKNGKTRGYKHVPHKDKPAQVVAKRNARERRRVQAVNTAFARLRRVVPVENSRGKRISKVKTLQHAIDYINGLQELLEQDGYHLMAHYYTQINKYHEDVFDDFNL